MNNDNPMIIIGVIVFIVILLMLIGALFLLKSGKGRGSKKKVKLHKVKRTVKGSTASKAMSAGSSPAKSTARAASGKTAPGKAASGKTAPGKAPVSPSKPVPLKGPDEGIEKYARMTGDYIRTKYGIELKRVGLKKYYSERHGFECVDYTYMPASGTFPAQFRTSLNDMDTALTNVSGVDTISFAADAAAGTYRTTFYLGK